LTNALVALTNKLREVETKQEQEVEIGELRKTDPSSGTDLELKRGEKNEFSSEMEKGRRECGSMGAES